MAKRVGVILSGCGHRDGTEIGEAMLTLLGLDRAGADVVCAAPDQPHSVVLDHRTGEPINLKPKRNVLVEAARIARGQVRSLAELRDQEIDALIIPGGEGVAQNLSTYAEKGELCEVHPDVARLLRAMLASRKPIGLICLAPIVAARILGPVAGVRVTLGPRGSLAGKHAAVMGADVRPCPVDDIVVDQKSRVVSTPAYMYDDARLRQVALGIEKLVRTVLSMTQDRTQDRAQDRTQDRAPNPRPVESKPANTPPNRGRSGEPTGRARGSA
jgi:enhancing lycopene biosynthesis protein 2